MLHQDEPVSGGYARSSRLRHPCQHPMSEREGSTGVGTAIASLRVSNATGAPVVTPCRTPARIETSSASNHAHHAHIPDADAPRRGAGHRS